MSADLVNVVFAGIGGQGIILASDMLTEAAFKSGYDVKKSELHGMSQRGGSVSSDVRFGTKVWSPMVPRGEADYLVVLSEDQVEVCRDMLKENGILLTHETLNQLGDVLTRLGEDPELRRRLGSAAHRLMPPGGYLDLPTLAVVCLWQWPHWAAAY